MAIFFYRMFLGVAKKNRWITRTNPSIGPQVCPGFLDPVFFLLSRSICLTDAHVPGLQWNLLLAGLLLFFKYVNFTKKEDFADSLYVIPIMETMYCIIQIVLGNMYADRNVLYMTKKICMLRMFNKLIRKYVC